MSVHCNRGGKLCGTVAVLCGRNLGAYPVAALINSLRNNRLEYVVRVSD